LFIISVEMIGKAVRYQVGVGALAWDISILLSKFVQVGVGALACAAGCFGLWKRQLCLLHFR